MMSEIIKSNQKTINIKRLIPYTALACTVGLNCFF